MIMYFYLLPIELIHDVLLYSDDEVINIFEEINEYYYEIVNLDIFWINKINLIISNKFIINELILLNKSDKFKEFYMFYNLFISNLWRNNSDYLDMSNHIPYLKIILKSKILSIQRFMNKYLTDVNYYYLINDIEIWKIIYDIYGPSWILLKSIWNTLYGTGILLGPDIIKLFHNYRINSRN